MNKIKVVHIVEEDMIPSLPKKGNHSISSDCNKMIDNKVSNTIVFRGDNALDTAYIRTNQNGSFVMTPIPRIKSDVRTKCFTTLSDILEAGKKYSSTSIVNGNNLQSDIEVTTIQVPILGLEEHNGSILPDYDPTIELPVPVDTLEVPVETILTESDEIQTIHIGDYPTVTTSLAEVKELQSQQPMVIASTDSEGNCYVAVQENEVIGTSVKKKEEIIVGKPCDTRNDVGMRRYLRYGRRYLRCGRNRMIADQITNIPVAEFKAQLNDTSDILGKFDIAPPIKRAVVHLQAKGKVFTTPGRKIMSSHLLDMFGRHLTTTLKPDEETFSDMTLLPVGYQPEVDPTKIKRITRRRRYPEAEEYQQRMFQEQMQQTFDNLVAESQKGMEAVFLENSGPLVENTQNNLQVLVEAAENGSFPQDDSDRVVDMYENGEINDNSIIVIHDGQETAEGTAYTQQNIEVLLAAAAGSGINQDNIHQVIICQQGSGTESFLPGNGSIIIVPNETLMDTITETVMTS